MDEIKKLLQEWSDLQQKRCKIIRPDQFRLRVAGQNFYSGVPSQTNRLFEMWIEAAIRESVEELRWRLMIDSFDIVGRLNYVLIKADPHGPKFCYTSTSLTKALLSAWVTALRAKGVFGK